MNDLTLTLIADGPELDHGVSALPCWVNPSTRALPTHTNKHHRLARSRVHLLQALLSHE
jgi:hypothetical protein